MRRRRGSSTPRRPGRRQRVARWSARCARTGLPTAPRCRSPNSARSARATGCDGTRTPTLSWPPVTTSDTRAARGRINVSGPGQNAAASFAAPSGSSPTHCASLRCVVQVDDHRMIGGTTLGGEDAAHRVGATGVGAETIDGLGRKRDELARTQPFRGARDRRSGGTLDAGNHRRTVTLSRICALPLAYEDARALLARDARRRTRRLAGRSVGKLRGFC